MQLVLCTTKARELRVTDDQLAASPHSSHGGILCDLNLRAWEHALPTHWEHALPTHCNTLHQRQDTRGQDLQQQAAAASGPNSEQPQTQAPQLLYEDMSDGTGTSTTDPGWSIHPSCLWASSCSCSALAPAGAGLPNMRAHSPMRLPCGR